MDQRRLMLFGVSVLAMLLIWNSLIVPLLVRPVPVDAEAEVKDDKPIDKPKDDNSKEKPVQKPDPTKPDPVEVVEQNPKEKPAPVKIQLKEFPKKTVTLGSLDPKSGYLMQVELTTLGGSVAKVELNDPRYRSIFPPHGQLVMIGGLDQPEAPLTFSTKIAAMDEQMEEIEGKPNAGNIHWELIGTDNQSWAKFRLISLDGRFQVTKTYSINNVKKPSDEGLAYAVYLDLEFEHLAGKKVTSSYSLQGPIGTPLETDNNPTDGPARTLTKYRDVAVGFLKSGGVEVEFVPVTRILKEDPQNWASPVSFAGIDLQYFSALVIPEDDQREAPYTKSINWQQIGENDRAKEENDVSLEFHSVPITIGGQGDDRVEKVTHRYRLFTGPKLPDILADHGASSVVQYGITSGLGIPQTLLALLRLYASWFPESFWPYGWAIILLTITVRGLMYPLSRKQALSAAKMQEIAPEIQAIRKKYEKDPERFAREQMALYRKHNFNPFGGCLTALIQLPVLFGLYQAISIAVDLRLARFLWIQDLTGPDQMFVFPFRIPWFGYDFNLLPILTMVLFIVQQKLLMPPPADEQQAQQYKVMNMMTIFMGLMFYHVPSGLCVYFIASSVWGLAERLVLPKPARAVVAG